MRNKKKLTICIPTFNRLEFIKKQLSFFQRQIENNKQLLQDISIIVADNASQDKTDEFLSSFNKKYNFFEYVINKSNLGLVGNIVNLLNLSKTEYVWFVSDDDELVTGVIEKIVNIINANNEPEFIFLNYSLKGKNGFTGKSGLRLDSKNAAQEVFREGYGSLVLITACVYKKKNLTELSNNPMFTWLSAPLLYSFYSCTKGPIYISKEICINYRHGKASYAGVKTISKLKFEEFVPILESLQKFGYDRTEIKKTIRIFFENQSHAHLLYHSINLLNSFRQYKYYSFKTILKIPSNIIYYLKK